MPWLSGQKITAQRLIDNTPQVIYHQALTAGSAGTIAATETVVYTTSLITLRTGRAYKFSIKTSTQSSVAGDRVTVRLRKTLLAGDVFIEVPHLVAPAASTNQLAESEVYASNSTGADINATFLLTAVRVAGTGNISLAGSAAAFVGHISVTDEGVASAFPNARAIT